MKLFGWELTRALTQTLPEEKQTIFGDALMRIIAAQDGGFYGDVTPENCMQAPTVHAIVTAISRRIAVSPVHLYKKTEKDGQDSKEKLPSHSVAILLDQPNSYQSRFDYWQDAASWFVRYGNFVAFKSQGTTGAIRELLPLNPRHVLVEQDQNTWAVTYKFNGQEVSRKKVHHVRGPARNGFWGDSPVDDVRTAIGLEILAEKFGATFFKNGATPFLWFNWLQGIKGFKTLEEEKQFISDFQNAFGGSNRFRAALAPPGMDKPTPIAIENEKAQFLQTREYQRAVIAGAFGVPPHLAGALTPAFNVEQKDGDFALQVVMPIAQAFEAAMERDLLTQADRNAGVIIRFNLDSILRADYASRVEGHRKLREAGILNANEIREREGMNPISPDDGGDEYWRPSNMGLAGEPTGVTNANPQPNGNAAGVDGSLHPGGNA